MSDKEFDSVCALIYRDGGIVGVSRKNDENDFGLPGGKIELGESVIAALYRETEEETGLNITSHRLVFIRVEPNGKKGYTYLCEATGDFNTKESGKVKVVSWDELTSGCFGKYNTALKQELDRIGLSYQR